MRTAVPILLLLAAPAAADDGHRYHGDGFEVRFPAQPKTVNQTVKTVVAELKVTTATYATPDGQVYLFSYTEFPAQAVRAENHAALFDGVREGLKGKGKLVSEADVEVGKAKLAGREVVIDKGKQQTRFRLAVHGTRLYQVAVVGPGEFVTGKGATAFLDSFEPGK